MKTKNKKQTRGEHPKIKKESDFFIIIIIISFILLCYALLVSLVLLKEKNPIPSQKAPKQHDEK